MIILTVVTVVQVTTGIRVSLRGKYHPCTQGLVKAGDTS